MTVEILKSGVITNLDAQPIVVATSGEGAFGSVNAQTDNVSHTSAFGSATGNASRQCRFPVTAKVKHVYVYGKGLDSNATAALAIDINVAFSDSATDGTPVGGQSLIPVAALTGAVTSLATYSSPNKMFGSGYVAENNSGAVKYTEVTYLNTFTPVMANQPMWANLGGTGNASAVPFTAGGGFAQQGGSNQIDNPGGFLDLLLVVATGASTAATGTLGTEVDYVI
jgi:hypothetical protein